MFRHQRKVFIVVKPQQWLEMVWDAQPHDFGYIFLSCKTQDGRWVEIHGQLAEGVDAIWDKLPPDAMDIYFCPNVFSQPHRRIEYAMPSVWLHADLDEVNPHGVELPVTVAWMTSKKRYQCLWRLRQPVKHEVHKALNQRITYMVGADKGGWSITKVLRVPGTRNYKRKTPEKVSVLWIDGQWYSPRAVLNSVRHVKTLEQATFKDLKLPEITSNALYHKYRRKLSKRAIALIKAKTAEVGERSDRLWELECLLLDAGLTAEETLVAVRDTVWNKHAGTRQEIPQLWREIQKAKEHVASNVEVKHKVPKRKLRLQKYSDFMARETPSELWTIEGVWSHNAHGLIAGEPKTFKSMVSTDLAISVASGCKFLGEFEAPKTGPVILIQEENTVGMMKDRFQKIANAKGLLGDLRPNGKTVEMEIPQDLPIHLMNNQGLNLTDDDHVAWLREVTNEVRPKLIVLDPLYLMIPGVDENSASGMVPVLQKLLQIKQDFDCGMLIVHHFNKPRSDEDRHPGNRISGTGVFYRWFESVVYLEKLKAPGAVRMSSEHRGHAPTSSIHLQFDLGSMGELDYFVDVEFKQNDSGNNTRSAMMQHLREGPKTSKELAELLGVEPSHVLTLARRMELKVVDGEARGKSGRPPKVISLPQG